MVERRISSPQEIKECYQKVGVVIFILNKEGEALMVRENTANQDTRKEVGSFGVICETSLEQETWEQTVIRGLEEELGIDSQTKRDFFKIDPERCFLGESLFVEGVLARVAVVYWLGDSRLPLSVIGDGEVSVAGWRRPEDLLSYPLRIGVRKVLQECLQEGLLEGIQKNLGDNLLPLSVENLKKVSF